MAVSISDARRHQQTLEARRREAARARAERLRARLPEAARLLRQRFGATRVLLFGSLAAGGDEPTESCDVDLAVSGLAPPVYFAAMAELAATVGGPVDLVRLEEASPALRQRIEETGDPL